MNAQSVRDRLLVLSRETREDYQRLLTRYAIERVLYRLSQSPHAEALVLKGATLFAVWTGKPHRATRTSTCSGEVTLGRSAGCRCSPMS